MSTKFEEQLDTITQYREEQKLLSQIAAAVRKSGAPIDHQKVLDILQEGHDELVKLLVASLDSFAEDYIEARSDEE